MKIQITGRHIEITEAIKQYAEEQVASIEKFNHHILKAHVILEVQNTIHHKCEINIEGKNLHLSAHITTKNLYESITKCIEKIEHQLKSHKFTYGDKNHRESTRDFENKVLREEENIEEAVV